VVFSGHHQSSALSKPNRGVSRGVLITDAARVRPIGDEKFVFIKSIDGADPFAAQLSDGVRGKSTAKRHSAAQVTELRHDAIALGARNGKLCAARRKAESYE
jgi:hypothetical protein